MRINHLRLGSVFAVCAAAAFGICGCHIEYEEDMTEEETPNAGVTEETHQIRVAYSDETYTVYLEDCVERYMSLHQNISVELVYMEADAYLETLSAQSLSANADQEAAAVSDVYLLENYQLGTAYLAGIAAKNTKSDETYYCRTALDACSYNGTLIAYPLGYRTTFLIGNRDLTGDLEISAFTQIDAFSDSLYGENAEGVIEWSSEEGSVSIEAIFKCNLKDLFLIYPFVGAGMNLGGKSGSDNADFSVCSSDSVAQAEQMLALIERYGIDTEAEYEECVADFLAGKTAFSVFSTDTLAQLQETDTLSYYICAFPDYSDSIKTAPLSITTALVVNPYSRDLETAEAFAYFATFSMANSLYRDAGVLSARTNVQYQNEEFSNIYASYEKSVPKNKLQFGEQAYPLIEIALHNIIAGEDIETELAAVDAYMQTQLK